MFDFIFRLLHGVLTYTSPRLFWAPGVDLMGCLPITNWENSLEFYLAVCLSICLPFCLPIHPPTHLPQNYPLPFPLFSVAPGSQGYL